MPVIPGPSSQTTEPACGAWAAPSDMDCTETITDDEALELLAISTSVLFEFTGRAWPGVCEATVRPPSRLVGCSCTRRDPCGRAVSELDLGTDLVEVVAVRVDGEVLDPSEYEVQNGRYLVALGDLRWPCCQRLDLADTEAGTWSIEIRYGGAPPVAGRRFAALLACELGKGLGMIEGTCSLPKATTSITRQGVTKASLDPRTLFPNGQTGIPSIDLWLGSIRVGRQNAPSDVVWPGMANRGRTT